MTDGLRFYWTAHPGDLMRSRLPEGMHVMLVASAHWDPRQKRLRVRRPPPDHCASLAIDSGGYTAARRWSTYPWSPTQYADWAQESALGLPLDWLACMDYACETGVDRQTLATNRERIRATHDLEDLCRAAAPHLPWLPVLQGDSLEERHFDLAHRALRGLTPTRLAGIGSICGRGCTSARTTLRYLRDQLPGVRFHGFGLHVQALDAPDVHATVNSWDSYAWTWPRGAVAQRPAHLLQAAGETRSSFQARIAAEYFRATIEPRLAAATPQLALL
jgi:hypothetical protein